MHIKHVTLRVKNLKQSIRFYEMITDLKIARRFPVNFLNQVKKHES